MHYVAQYNFCDAGLGSPREAILTPFYTPDLNIYQFKSLFMGEDFITLLCQLIDSSFFSLKTPSFLCSAVLYCYFN